MDHFQENIYSSKMNKFEEYMYSIKIMVFDYLCDTLYDTTKKVDNFTQYLLNDNDLFLNNYSIFTSYKRTRFYDTDKILSYYGSSSIPIEFRSQFIMELRRILCDNRHYNVLIKKNCDEGTYDDRLLVHFCENYAIHYISLRHFKQYYHEKTIFKIKVTKGKK